MASLEALTPPVYVLVRVDVVLSLPDSIHVRLWQACLLEGAWIGLGCPGYLCMSPAGTSTSGVGLPGPSSHFTVIGLQERHCKRTFKVPEWLKTILRNVLLIITSRNV